MGDANSAESEAILVLCHSFFHDAFRPQKPVDAEKIKMWISSRFITNFILEKQAETPEESAFAVTSRSAFDSFVNTFLSENPSINLVEIVAILSNAIYIAEAKSFNQLPIDEGVIAICDTLYSRSNYAPILVTNIPKKVSMVEDFYAKSTPEREKVKIPFPIYRTVEAEMFLRGRFSELCKAVDKRIEESGY